MSAFADIPTTILADVLDRDRVMDISIRPLWTPVSRAAGPAFTVHCPPGDNLMLHAAIYRADPGSVIVVESGDLDHALAGGNVCAVAHRHGIAGFVLDGLIRDVGEVRRTGFPVFARGVIPFPGAKAQLGTHRAGIRVGGVDVRQDDIVVADEDGVVVVPAGRGDEVLRSAQARLAKEESETLFDWEAAHRVRLEKTLGDLGFERDDQAEARNTPAGS